jgi:hypothetical protein
MMFGYHFPDNMIGGLNRLEFDSTVERLEKLRLG